MGGGCGHEGTVMFGPVASSSSSSAHVTKTAATAARIVSLVHAAVLLLFTIYLRVQGLAGFNLEEENKITIY